MSSLTDAQRVALKAEAIALEHQGDALLERREYLLAGIAYVDASDRFRRARLTWPGYARVLLERAGVAFACAGPEAETHRIAAYAKWARLVGMTPDTEDVA